jgi:GDP-4-dehydro-6-deoxy-D-mannose reductase
LRFLIIGVSGFVGGHLARRLAEAGHMVEGWGRRLLPPPGLDAYASVDLLGPGLLPEPAAPWDGAVVLSGHSVPGHAWTEEMVFENLRMTAAALGHLARTSPGLRTLVASSAHVYAPAEHPVAEDEPLRPQGLYGLSKRLCEEWARNRGGALDLQIVRLFNQVGPGMPEGLLATDLMARLRSGEDPLVMKGSDTVRDFTDVRDGADALARLLTAELPEGGTWNLCSGRPTPVRDLARAAMEAVGAERGLRFLGDRPDTLVGDPSRLKAATGWEPRIPLARSLRDLAEAGGPIRTKGAGVR